MSLVRVLDTLETDRLIVRHRRVDEAAIYRQLWTERDLRVPPHRRIDAKGRPTVEDIAAQIREEGEVSGPGILAVERKGTADVIGYCGLTIHGKGSPDEAEWPTSCYVRLTAAGTQLRQVGPWSRGRARRATSGYGQGSGTGMSRRDGSLKSSGSAKQARWSPTRSTATAC
jgi:hypothetical protein